MSNDLSNRQTSSDEIDLGVLFSKIRNAFTRLFQGVFKGLLSLYSYLRKNFFWFVGLGAIGVISGLVINKITGDKFEVSVIVTPNLDSRDYLYSIIADIQSDLDAQDTLFFKSLGMDIEKMDDFAIEILPLKAENSLALEQEIEFVNLLKDIPGLELPNSLIESIVAAQMSKDQAITFYFKNPEIGEDYASKLLAYIKNNPYYNRLNQAYIANAEQRILQNKERIGQVDSLISSYTQKMLVQQPAVAGSLLLENQEPLNIPSLFQLKNELIRDTEDKRLELERREGAFTTLKFGKTRTADLAWHKSTPIVIPVALLGLFIVLGIVRFLDQKAKEVLKH